MAWQRIETCPENTDVWVFYDFMDGGERYAVARFTWMDKVTEELEEEIVNASGKRRIYQERKTREREWTQGATPAAWMLLPDPPEWIA